MNVMKHQLRSLWHLPRNLLAGAIALYQYTLSPDHGPLRHMHPYGFCRHEPTCSMYGKHVILQRGVIIGLLLATRRVLSCHPWRELDEEKIMKIMTMAKGQVSRSKGQKNDNL